MNATEIADKIETIDVDAFAWLLGLEFTHDDEPSEAKATIVRALRMLADSDLPTADDVKGILRE